MVIIVYNILRVLERKRQQEKGKHVITPARKQNVLIMKTLNALSSWEQMVTLVKKNSWLVTHVMCLKQKHFYCYINISNGGL